MTYESHDALESSLEYFIKSITRLQIYTYKFIAERKESRRTKRTVKNDKK